jgi:hypothetical protein
MKRVIGRTPSASMVVAVIALVVAASGTAVAASKLVSGDSLIKKHSLSGNRLRNHTITGTQVNLSKLGKVPSARQADQATSATNATNATNAANAGALGGQPASDFLTTTSRIGTPGIVKASGTTTGNTVPLFTTGPFTVTMTCTKTASGTTLTMTGTSGEANSDLNDHLVAVPGTPQDLGGNTDITTATTTFSSKDNVNIDLEAPSGAQAMVVGADGINSLGADCWANWVGIR